MSLWRPDPVLFPVRLPAAVAQDDASATQRALAAAAAALEPAAWPRGTRLAGVLDAALSPTFIVPWHPRMRSRAERDAFARHCAHEVYGELAQGWTVCMDAAPWGRAALACAVDAGLHEGLRALTAERGWRLVSLQPRLVRAVNADRRSVAGDSFWFVLPEPPALTLLLVRERQPERVKRVAGTVADIDRVLAREAFALGLAGHSLPVVLHRPDGPALPVPHLPARAPAPARAA